MLDSVLRWVRRRKAKVKVLGTWKATSSASSWASGFNCLPSICCSLQPSHVTPHPACRVPRMHDEVQCRQISRILLFVHCSPGILCSLCVFFHHHHFVRFSLIFPFFPPTFNSLQMRQLKCLEAPPLLLRSRCPTSTRTTSSWPGSLPALMEPRTWRVTMWKSEHLNC